MPHPGMGQTVKFFKCAENVGFNSENCAEEILPQTICARIPSQNTAFEPRSPLQPYSMRPATVISRIILVLALSLFHPSHPDKELKLLY